MAEFADRMTSLTRNLRTSIQMRNEARKQIHDATVELSNRNQAFMAHVADRESNPSRRASRVAGRTPRGVPPEGRGAQRPPPRVAREDARRFERHADRNPQDATGHGQPDCSTRSSTLATSWPSTCARHRSPGTHLPPDAMSPPHPRQNRKKRVTSRTAAEREPYRWQTRGRKDELVQGPCEQSDVHGTRNPREGKPGRRAARPRAKPYDRGKRLRSSIRDDRRPDSRSRTGGRFL